MIKTIILINILLISYVFCNDIVFSTNEKDVFREIEGKFPLIKIEIDENDYNEFLSVIQVDNDKIVNECNLDASLLPNYETKVTLIYEND
eukprot:jgi/Orpsp1_1/1179467/evm.model.c7180000069452.1